MTGRNIGTVVGLVLLALAGLLLVRGTRNDTGSRSDRSDERSAATPAGWRIHSSRDLPFTFAYPPGASVDRVDPAIEREPLRVRVRLIGPKSGEATEITNGFTLYARVVRMDASTTLRELARRVLEQESRRSAATLTRVEVAGKRAYRFTTRSELGDEVRHLLLPADDDRSFVVSYVISGPAGRNYGRQVRGIIGSLELTSGVQGSERSARSSSPPS